MDAQSGAEQLLSLILSAASPPAVSSALSSTLAYLRLHPPDHCRPFLSLTFPALLSRLLLPSPSPPWIHLPDPLLPVLLRPSGPLLSVLLRHSLLLRFSFPLDRLPPWIPLALPHAPSLLHPLLLSRAQPDPPRFLLSAFDYYLLWFAYHPLAGPPPPTPPTSHASWTSPWRRPSRAAPRRCPLYPRLLYAYLRAFVPLHHEPPGAALDRAEFVLNVFVHFWLVGDDFLPLPQRALESLGERLPLQQTPPPSGLSEVIEVLVKYVGSGLVGPAEEGGRAVLGSTVPNLARLWNSTMQRPLYRYILRSFLFCPVGTAVKDLCQVVSLWAAYLEPWRTSSEELEELELPREKNGDGGLRKETRSLEKGKEGHGPEVGFGPLWSDYVASNYLFYSSLVVHFLGFAHRVLHINAEVVVRMTLKVIHILTSSRQLLDLLKEIDAAYHSKSSGTSSLVYNSSYKYIPSIREQLQDWEDGLCESEADGSFLHENWNHDLKFFSENEDGAHHLLQLLILRAEPELQATSIEKEAENFKNLESLKSQMNMLFGGLIRRSQSPSVPQVPRQVRGRDDIFSPSRPGVGKHKWAGIRYEGDWMRRPISDSEVAWLVRYLVRLSDWLNMLLGLNRNSIDEHAGPSYLDLPPLDLETELGPREVFWKFLGLIVSFLVLLSKAVLMFMRSHGWRINLRVLASKKIITALFVYFFVSIVRKAL